MERIARHLLSYRSPIDSAEQPYLVCAPATATGEPLPVVYLLHDTLAEPTPSGFVEEAFRQAAAWLPALADAPPMLLVQPFGRGNAGWLGWGACDLFDVGRDLALRFLCDPNAVSLMGIGAGATGALQLACWFPESFAAVAAIGAWGDERLDLPLGAAHWPAWERAQRQAVSPRVLAANLGQIPVHLEHPWWFQGLQGTAGPEHGAVLARTLRHEGVRVETPAQAADLELHRHCPQDPARLVAWLAGQRRPSCPSAFRFKSYSLRAAGAYGVHILGLEQPDHPGTFEARTNRDRLQITTRSIDALAIRIAEESTLHIDQTELTLPAADPLAGKRWVRLERLDGRWQAIDGPIVGEMSIRAGVEGVPAGGGPALELRWGGVLFVPGTLGGDAENEGMRSLADHLRASWLDGSDSINPHPGDRRVAIDFPIRPDRELTDEDLARCHLILVGNPKLNLVLARYEARLPCTWRDRQAGCGFELAGRSFDDPADVAFFVCRNPDHPARSMLVVWTGSIAGMASAARVRTAFLPDYLVHRGHRVLDWGHWGTSRQS